MHDLLCRQSIGAQGATSNSYQIQTHVLDLLVFLSSYALFPDKHGVESSLQRVAARKKGADGPIALAA